jgi:hypothetical protein
MAQSGFTPISIYYSATAAAAPTAGNLVAGELAINTADGKLFYKDSAGVVQTIASKAGALGDVVGPASATDNAVSRFDLTTGKLIQNSLVTISDTGAISAPVDASISGLTVGKGAGSIATNSVVGLGALPANTSGLANTAMGSATMASNTTGGYNSAYGRNALGTNTTGSNNTALGYNSLVLQTTGGKNTAIGDSALFSNTTADNNTAVGYQALYANTTGEQSVAIGAFALDSQTSGAYNTTVGYDSMSALTTGQVNTCIGYGSGNALTTSSGNTFLGAAAGSAVTTGAKNTVLGRYNGNQGGLDIRTASNYIVLSDGDGNPRLYSDASGRIRIGGVSGGNDIFRALQSAAQSTATFENSNGSAPTGISVYFSGTTPNNTTQDFLNCGDPTNAKLYIYSNGTVSNRTGTYNTISDVKIKQDIVDAGSQWNDIKAVRFRKYRLIDDVKANSDAPYLLGVVAQELQQTSPNLVEECADRDGELILGVKQSIIFMKAAKALQEAMARIETLEAKVNTLENK